MSLEPGLYQLLSQSTTLQGLAGGTPFVFAVVLPEDLAVLGTALPCITYQTVGGSAAATMNTSGMQRRRLQLDFWADYEQGTYDQAIALRDAAISLLDGFRGALPNGLFVNLHFLQIIDHFESDARQYRSTAEFYAFYARPAS